MQHKAHLQMTLAAGSMSAEPSNNQLCVIKHAFFFGPYSKVIRGLHKKLAIELVYPGSPIIKIFAESLKSQ